MAGPVSAVSSATQITRTAEHLSDGARALLDGSRQVGVQNMALLGQDLASVAARDPKRAAELLAEIKPQLAAQDQQRLVTELAEHLDADIARRLEQQQGAHAAEAAAAQRELALDLTQIGLSIVGIFDPTPVSDGLDGLISLFRGDMLGAGISAVSMIPYIGDVAKLGKLGKFAETVAKAVDLAKIDVKFAERVAPALDKIRDALKAVPLDSLPKPAREALQKMMRKLDELPRPGGYASTVRGNRVLLEGVETRSIQYVKRDRASYDTLRKEFDSTKRGEFLKSLAADPQKVQALRRTGLDDAAIARIGQGKVPSGYQVHHKLPLDDGGTNSLDNLVLIKNDPFHIGITNAQSSLAGELAVGQTKRIDWPVVPGFIYPPK